MRRLRTNTLSHHLDPKFASGIRRLIATLIDFLPPMILTLWLAPGDWQTFSPPSLPLWAILITLPLIVFLPFLQLAPLFLIALALALPMAILTEARFGQTLGKFILGIRVITTDGGPISLRTSTIRNVVKLYDFMLTLYLWPVLVVYDVIMRRPLPGRASGAYRHVWSENGQRWGDELAGTYVIRGRWKPVRIGSHAAASSKRGSLRHPNSPVPRSLSGIRLSGRHPDR